MKASSSNKYSEITADRVLQTTTFNNVTPEFAERVAETIKKLSEILYVSIEREMNEKNKSC